MGSTESKVGVQPLGIVAATDGPLPSAHRRSVVTCNVFRKQNRTVPAVVGSPATRPPPVIPRSSPTIEAVKEAKSPSSAESNGPSIQLLTEHKVVSLHQLTAEELSTQFLKAVKNGDLKLLQRIVEVATTKQLSLINIRGMWESTPLIYACQYCHEPIALWLLDAGADVLAVNERGVTCLLLASLEGMNEAVQRILEHQSVTSEAIIDAQIGVVYNSAADLNVRASPLLAASMNGHANVVRLLLDRNADVNAGVPTSTGPTSATRTALGVQQYPLLVAAKYGHSEVAQLLIKSGANITHTDGNDNHALLIACDAGRDDCALALLQLLDPQDSVTWKRSNCHGLTALHCCAIHGLVKAAAFMLVNLGWSCDLDFVNAKSSTRHESAVLMACRKKQLEMVKILLHAGADATQADRGNMTALDVLRREKRDELVRLWEEMVESRGAVRRQDMQAPVVEEPKQVLDVTSPPVVSMSTLEAASVSEESAHPMDSHQLTPPWSQHHDHHPTVEQPDQALMPDTAVLMMETDAVHEAPPQPDHVVTDGRSSEVMSLLATEATHETAESSDQIAGTSMAQATTQHDCVGDSQHCTDRHRREDVAPVDTSPPPAEVDSSPPPTAPEDSMNVVEPTHQDTTTSTVEDSSETLKAPSPRRDRHQKHKKKKTRPSSRSSQGHDAKPIPVRPDEAAKPEPALQTPDPSSMRMPYNDQSEQNELDDDF